MAMESAVQCLMEKQRVQEAKRNIAWTRQVEELCNIMEKELVIGLGKVRSRLALKAMMNQVSTACYRSVRYSQLLALARAVTEAIYYSVHLSPADYALRDTVDERQDLKSIASCLDASAVTGASDEKEEELIFAKLPKDLQELFGFENRELQDGSKIMALAHVPESFSEGMYSTPLCGNDSLLLHHTAFGDDGMFEEVSGIAVPESASEARQPPLSAEMAKQQALKQALAAAAAAAMEEFKEDFKDDSKFASKLRQHKQASGGFILGSDDVRNVVHQPLKKCYQLLHGRDVPNKPADIATLFLVLYRCDIGVKRSWSKFQLTFPNVKRIHIRECHLGRKENSAQIADAIYGLMSRVRDDGDRALRELVLEDCVVADSSVGEAPTEVPVTLAWFLQHVPRIIPQDLVQQTPNLVKFPISSRASSSRVDRTILRFRNM